MTCDEHWAAASRMTSPNGEPVHPAQGGGWLYNADPESLDGCLLPLPDGYAAGAPVLTEAEWHLYLTADAKSGPQVLTGCAAWLSAQDAGVAP